MSDDTMSDAVDKFQELRKQVGDSDETKADYLRGLVGAVPSLEQSDVSVSSVGTVKGLKRSGLKKLFKYITRDGVER